MKKFRALALLGFSILSLLGVAVAAPADARREIPCVDLPCPPIIVCVREPCP